MELYDQLIWKITLYPYVWYARAETNNQPRVTNDYQLFGG